MNRSCRNRLLVMGITAALTSTAARAELYKCQGLDGHTSYQQTACDSSARATGLAIDNQRPNRATTSTDYAIEKQLETMRNARSQRAQARAQARQDEETEGADHIEQDRFDRARCAKHRSEVAKWRQKVMNAYRTRSEKEYNQNQLAYHQALVERYCEE